MPHPSNHLRAKRRAQAAADDAWAEWDRAWTRHVRRLAGRSDLTVVVAPGAGGGAPACFYPSLKRVEVNAKYVGAPDVADPRRAGHKQHVPTGYGLLVHEASHAAHSRWHTPAGAGTAVGCGTSSPPSSTPTTPRSTTRGTPVSSPGCCWPGSTPASSQRGMCAQPAPPSPPCSAASDWPSSATYGRPRTPSTTPTPTR